MSERYEARTKQSSVHRNRTGRQIYSRTLPKHEEVKRGIRLSDEVMIKVLATIQYWVGFHWALVTVDNGKNYRYKRLEHREIWESREMGEFMC